MTYCSKKRERKKRGEEERKKVQLWTRFLVAFGAFFLYATLKRQYAALMCAAIL